MGCLDLLVHLPVSKFIPSRMVLLCPQYLTELLKARQMVWGPCYQLLLAPGTPSAHTLTIQSGVNIGFTITCPLPSTDPDMGWQCFLKSSLLNKGCQHLGNMGNPASPEEPLG